MLIGTMNHPGQDVLDEIQWMSRMGMEFIDLTLEPPKAASWQVDLKVIARALDDHGLSVVGHTAYYLPLASPFEPLRRAAVEELKRCLRAFGKLGAKWMNVHPGRQPPLHDRQFTIDRNLETLADLLPVARSCGVGLMIENIPGEFNSSEQMAPLLDAVPELGLHLDVGHTNLMVVRNTTDQLLADYGDRLRHVHMHDNKGGTADLHLPLGTGTVDVRRAVRGLRNLGYDGTITLEVFTPDRHYVAYSRDLLRRLWNESAAKAPRLKKAAA
jgi:sugar phosphate isomerase/epimerase